MKIWREWAEEHWAEVGTSLSIGSAVTVAILLAVAFNVLATW